MIYDEETKQSFYKSPDLTHKHFVSILYRAVFKELTQSKPWWAQERSSHTFSCFLFSTCRGSVPVKVEN